MGSVVRKGLGLLLGANTTIKYLDVGAGSLVLAGSNSHSGVIIIIIIIIQMCLIRPSIIISRLAKPRVFCCQQAGPLSQYHGELSAIQNLSLTLKQCNQQIVFLGIFWL